MGVKSAGWFVCFSGGFWTGRPGVPRVRGGEVEKTGNNEVNAACGDAIL